MIDIKAQESKHIGRSDNNYSSAPIKPRPKAATTPLAMEFTFAAPVKGAVPVVDGTEPVPVAVPVGKVVELLGMT